MKKKRSVGIIIISLFELVAIPIFCAVKFKQVVLRPDPGFGVLTGLLFLPLIIWSIVAGVLTLKLKAGGRMMTLSIAGVILGFFCFA